MEVASLLGLLFWLSNRTSSSFCSSAARPLCWAASKAFIVGPWHIRNAARSADGVPGKSNVQVSRANEIRSRGPPAAANRSITLASSPHVIGLTKPSGGGGKYEVLILKICATNVGSPG